MLCSYALYSQGCQAEGYKHTTVYLKHIQAHCRVPEKTNLSNFHRVLGRTTSMVFNFVPLDNFFKPEIKISTRLVKKDNTQNEPQREP